MSDHPRRSLRRTTILPETGSDERSSPPVDRSLVDHRSVRYFLRLKKDVVVSSSPLSVHPTEIFFEPDESSPLDLRCETNARDCRTRWLDEWRRPLNVSSIDQFGVYLCEICCPTNCRNSSTLIYPVRPLSTLRHRSICSFCLDARRAAMKPSFVRSFVRSFCVFYFRKEDQSTRRRIENEFVGS